MINIFTGQLALKNLQLSLLWKVDGSCILFSSFLVCIFLCFITTTLIELIVLYGLYGTKDFDHCSWSTSQLGCFVSGLGGLLMTNCIHLKDVVVFRPWQSFDVLFGALVDASGRAELYGITDQSINPDLGLYEPISILEASTPKLLIVQDPFVSLLRTPIASVWEVDVDSFKFL
jgi:hypothetical protein